MDGAVTLLQLYAFMLWTGKTFFFVFLHQSLGSHVPNGCTENLARGIQL
jgi:hypothetical protein